MYRITVGGAAKAFEAPQTLREIMRQVCPDKEVFACFTPVEEEELTHTISRDAELIPVTYDHEEGRRIYERAARFVLLLAVRRLYPGVKVRLENSIGYGVFMHLVGRSADEETLHAIENEMHRLVERDLPFIREKWTTKQAIHYFESEGAQDKARLLAYRPHDHFYVYGCGGMYEYFYGIMPPSTGSVKAFTLVKSRGGFIMQLPSPKDPTVPAHPATLPRHLEAFDLSTDWCRIMGVTNIADVNDMIRDGRFREFIRINEALQDRHIAHVADAIVQKKARAVFVAGPSSSGKTTFSNRLRIHLKVLGYQAHLISLDDFYRNKDTLPLQENGRPDLQALDALDIPEFHHCASGLLRGDTVTMPHYDFTINKRSQTGYEMALSEGDIVIFEGIHGLNPALHGAFDPALIYKVYISQLTCLNLDDHNRIRSTDARLMRRIVRDHQFRNTSPAETLSMWPDVRAGEEKWIFPYQEQADIVFNSVLHYELPFIRDRVYELLLQIPKKDPGYLMARRLVKILHYILPVPADAENEIPPLSILREFIGGNTFYS